MPLLKMVGSPRLDRWGVYFAMLSSAGTTVDCTITLGALDELVSGRGETTQEQQAAIFDARRADIESAASKKYDRGEIELGMVVIRPEDLPKE